MLQQTTFSTVQNRFSAFIAVFPTITALAKASQTEVLRHWAGLGYYARARNLHYCAQVIVDKHHGVLPQSIPELRALPGIGAYTAAAIAAIAYDVTSVATDSNVKRIYARLVRNLLPIQDNNPDLHTFFLASQHGHSPREHLQAWLDFGEILCRSRHPKCADCPVQKLCLGRDIAVQLPIKPTKKPRRQLYAYAYWLENADGAVWLRRRPPRGLLAGMLEVPTSHWQENAPSHTEGIPQLRWQATNQQIQHRFTHIDLTVHILRARGFNDTDLAQYSSESAWYRLNSHAELGLPTLMKKIVGAMLSAK